MNGPAQPLSKDYLAVVAIDFGTTFSGYAFSFQHEFGKIYTSSSNRKLLKDRVPTAILLQPDKTFDSFGYEAESKYTKLSEAEEHNNWHYFPRFKMMLYKTRELHRAVMLMDSQGRPMSAMTIFSMAIQYLMSNARDAVHDSITSVEDGDILWIITVPAIWSDSAKQFMKEAAQHAGIAAHQLRLVLEPEAASLFCMEQPVTRISDEDDCPWMAKMGEGHKYILADLGGGTADICVHEVVANGNLREIHRAIGDAFGATCVDLAFQEMFVSILGEVVWTAFKMEYMDEYMDLMQRFEVKKADFTSTIEQETVFSLPVGLLSVINEKRKLGIQDLIAESDFAELISIDKRNRLKVCWSTMESFFKQTVTGIANLLSDIVSQGECQDVQTLFLVGGFSESPYLREVIKSKLPLQVVFPLEGSLVVLKGAVLMGFKPRTIIERKARYTYGFDIRRPFQEGVHPENQRTVRDGKTICTGIFDKLIEIGQVLQYGQVFMYHKKGSSTSKQTRHEMRYVSLWKSDLKDPKYCSSEDKCACVGEIEMKPPKSGWPDRVHYNIQLVVGEAEFVVRVFNETTRAEYAAKMEFL